MSLWGNMPRLLRSLEEENSRQISRASHDYLDKLLGTFINPNAPMRYDPPQRDISKRPPFRRFFNYF